MTTKNRSVPNPVDNQAAYMRSIELSTTSMDTMFGRMGELILRRFAKLNDRRRVPKDDVEFAGMLGVAYELGRDSMEPYVDSALVELRYRERHPLRKTL